MLDSMLEYLDNPAAICDDVWRIRINRSLQGYLLLQQMLHSIQDMVQYRRHAHLHYQDTIDHL